MRPVLVRSVEQYMRDVQRRLKKIGCSRGALARKMEIAMTQLSRYLRLHTEPSMSTFIDIEKALQSLEDKNSK